jgi:hypothetical protein
VGCDVTYVCSLREKKMMMMMKMPPVISEKKKIICFYFNYITPDISPKANKSHFQLLNEVLFGLKQ